jgi:Ca2+-binding RTX toxin-like protein
VMTGGAGADHFTFGFEAQDSAGDLITDFTRGTDKISVSKVGFFIDVTLATPRLVTGNAPVATTDAATFLFERDTGRLWFDLDGNGGVFEAELVVTLQGVSNLSASDILLTG